MVDMVNCFNLVFRISLLTLNLGSIVTAFGIDVASKKNISTKLLNLPIGKKLSQFQPKKFSKNEIQKINSLQLLNNLELPQTVTKYSEEGLNILMKSFGTNITVPKILPAVYTDRHAPEYFGSRQLSTSIKNNADKVIKSTPRIYSMSSFSTSLSRFENLFYKTTFDKLTSICPSNGKENGISFVQTGLFLYLVLMALSTELDLSSKIEIDNLLDINTETMQRIIFLKDIISSLPNSSKALKIRWASHLLVKKELTLTQLFMDAANAVKLQIMRLNGTQTSDELSDMLNKMVEEDSEGALRNTFEEDDFNGSLCSILITTLNIRARWRSAPTVMNGTRRFYDSVGLKEKRSVRMIRINDIMGYTSLDQWNAEAIEISYAAPNLTLLLLVPRGNSLRTLAENMAEINLQEISNKLNSTRVAVTLPLFTFRMTLLLPEKLRTMGITRLVGGENCTCDNLKLSHAAQRLMFWSEAGRNAYKDDGIEWDEIPEREIVVNRPYIFYVRWNNITLMNAHPPAETQPKGLFQCGLPEGIAPDGRLQLKLSTAMPYLYR